MTCPSCGYLMQPLAVLETLPDGKKKVSYICPKKSCGTVIKTIE